MSCDAAIASSRCHPKADPGIFDGRGGGGGSKLYFYSNTGITSIPRQFSVIGHHIP